MISANVPSGFLCPQLRKVAWTSWGQRTFNNLFVSSRLTAFEFSSRDIEAIAGLASVMTELQTPCLRTLNIEFSPLEDPLSTNVTTALSSFVLRCGSLLTEIVILVPLTDAAIRHIMQLPELTLWETKSRPPDVPGLSPLDTFPKLERIYLRSVEAINWLPFFKTDTYRASSNQVTHVPRNRGPYQTLTTIYCDYAASCQVNAAFMSPVMLFRGLNTLHLEWICSTGWCGFRLTDDDVGEMAAALPNLTALDLGSICSADSCQTTVASLLIISTCCKHLKVLRTHFRTGNLLHDLDSMPSNPRLHGLFQLPRCRVRGLCLSNAPVRMGSDCYKRVAEGFISIFPSIDWVYGNGRVWPLVDKELERLRGSRRDPTSRGLGDPYFNLLADAF